MNRYLIAATGLMLAIAMPLTSLAQARHDEKPHATMRPAPEPMQHAMPATGGRHDEGMTMHGMKQPPAKKESGHDESATPAQAK